ncbi:CBS domain-containing protein [Acidihalobacter prosperus]
MPIQKLHPYPLPQLTTIVPYNSGLPELVKADNPAIDVMTDLRRVKAITTIATATLDSAHQHMIHTGVRLLLVLDRSDKIVGLITARDIMGEKPMAVAAREHISHDQLLVEHIMTPASQIQVMDRSEVEHAQVADVVKALREADRQHALVLESGSSDNDHAVCGIFSLTQIGRQMGVTLEPSGIAQSLAELEQMINHQ